MFIGTFVVVGKLPPDYEYYIWWEVHLGPMKGIARAIRATESLSSTSVNPMEVSRTIIATVILEPNRRKFSNFKLASTNSILHVYIILPSTESLGL